MQHYLKVIILEILFICVYSIKSLATQPIKKNLQDIVYSNEWFSVNIPKGWEYADSTWEKNEFKKVGFEMNISNSLYGDAWITIVRSTTPIPWESPKQAAELSRSLKELPQDEAMKYGVQQDPNYIGVLTEKDSIEIGGLPAYCTVYEFSAEDEDTLMNFQFTVLNPDDNQLYYVNQNMYFSTVNNNPQLIDECNNILFSLRFKRKNSKR